MHITTPGADALAASHLSRPCTAARRLRAATSALLIFAASALPGMAQSVVSTFDNIVGPTFVALDANRSIGGTTATWLYVSEHGNIDNTGGGRILRFNLAAPTTAPVDIGGGHFVSPDGILIDPTTGDLTIADRAQDRITRISNTGALKWTFGSNAAGAPDEMHGPCGLAIDSTGAIYVTEHGETLSSPAGASGNFVSKYIVSATGQAQRQFRIGGTGSGNAQFANTGPYGVTIANNQLFVSDGFNARVQVFGLDGTYSTQFAIPNTLPLGMTVDSTGALWVAESSGQGDGPIERVEKMTTAGVSSGTLLTAANPTLMLPFDVAIDPATNRAYVSDYTNHRVVVFDLAASDGTSSGGTSSGGTSSGGDSSGGTSTGGTSTGSGSGGTTTGGTSGTPPGNASVAVTSVTVPANGTYRAGDALTFTVHFSAPVHVVSTHADSIDSHDAESSKGDKSDDHDKDGGDVDDADVSITWNAVDGGDSGRAVLVGPIKSSDLTFKYQVRGNDSAPTGIRLDSTLALGTGIRITDAAGQTVSADQLKLPWASNPLPGVVLVPAKDSNPGKGGSGATTGVVVSVGKKGARIVNLSSRVRLKGGDANHTVAVGFVVSGTGVQTVLIRAVGPGLRAFGISDAAANPSVTVQSAAGDVVGSNAGWNDSQALAQMAQHVGAFALNRGSRDAALILPLQPGAYTATITSAKSDGEALLEIYDATDAGAAAPQLINISTRGYVDADGDLIVGFSVQGSDARRVLVRAVGPALTGFGVHGVLANPNLAVHDAGGAVVAANDDWGTPTPIDSAHPAASGADIAAANASAGAFPLTTGSQDAAVATTLAPGSYSAVVTGAGHSAGAVVVEVYELP